MSPLQCLLRELTPPECAVCSHPIEELHVVQRITTSTYMFVARCHGQEECVEINEEQLEGLRYRTLRFGRAFENKLLPGGKKELPR